MPLPLLMVNPLWCFHKPLWIFKTQFEKEKLTFTGHSRVTNYACHQKKLGIFLLVTLSEVSALFYTIYQTSPSSLHSFHFLLQANSVFLILQPIWLVHHCFFTNSSSFFMAITALNSLLFSPTSCLLSLAFNIVFTSRILLHSQVHFLGSPIS